MARDFLVRDLGEGDRDDHRIRRIALKPKHAFRLHLLSSETFPIRKAVVDLDIETLFPLHISIAPSDDAPITSLLGSNVDIHVSYRDLRLLSSGDRHPAYEPPAGARVFEERRVAADNIEDVLPFPLTLDPFERHGYDSSRMVGLATVETGGDRGFATLTVPSADASESDRSAPRVGLAVGNYTSHNMARRRSTFSEHGTSAESDDSVRLLNRAQFWADNIPGFDGGAHAPMEAFFETDGTLWFLTAVGLDADRMEAIAHDLRAAQSPA
jgi:hypothetical protein